MRRPHAARVALLVASTVLAYGFTPSGLLSQAPPTPVIPGVKTGGSRNIDVLGHLQLDSIAKTADITIEQELSRPYVYVARRLKPSGVDIINVKDPSKPRIIWAWRIENGMLHQGAGSLNPMYLKSHGRYYLTNAFQFQSSGPDADLGAIVWDVTGLPDTSKIRELARIRLPEAPGGFHESYAYKHSDGRALLFTVTQGPFAHIYDIDEVVTGKPGLIGKIPQPDSVFSINRYGRAYHDMYVAYDPATHRDIFYGSGYAGYYVWDVSQPENPKMIMSVSGVAGVDHAHSFMVTPDGRYAAGESEEQYQPIRIFDLKPGLDGTVKNISRPIGAWTADWHDLPHNMEIRWPYVFVSAYEDGLQVFNMMDPTNPYTVGYYYTCECPHQNGSGVMNGAWGVQVRNADGLIVISDMVTGFWSFKMEGFDGWNGHQWGMPNVSSAQDWDNGPEGAPKPRKVS